ncbi:hypothetical protein GRF59_12340 [Paenibacillus sp. HJL G12]|uniref:Uncharacterized protein n=1 Tax=Paenibacillus dendrobii TaxID=2691084 RepID=A0A7X3LHP9_9BACL|nr:hypothetical protein [Paenibacillus dendrobii]MWV44420.1 hypothetical protein [Paenibacillus dendrobii]
MLQADTSTRVQAVIRLHAIELFILHLPSSKSEPLHSLGDHYRVLMRIHSSCGKGWGEIYLNEGNRPVDWVTWASWYERFLHRNFADEASLQNDILHSIQPFHLPRVQLLCDAIHETAAGRTTRGSVTEDRQDSGHLLRFAEAYVSLF